MLWRETPFRANKKTIGMHETEFRATGFSKINFIRNSTKQSFVPQANNQRKRLPLCRKQKLINY